MTVEKLFALDIQNNPKVNFAFHFNYQSLLDEFLYDQFSVRESLGMRIGGGIGSNEGDTPIYVANIHPHGCIGKSKQLKVSSVFGNISKGSPGHPKFWQQKNRTIGFFVSCF